MINRRNVPKTLDARIATINTSLVTNANDFAALAPAHYSDAPAVRKLARLLTAAGIVVVDQLDTSSPLGLNMTAHVAGNPLAWIKVHVDELTGVSTRTHSGGNAAELWTEVPRGLSFAQIAAEIAARLAARGALDMERKIARAAARAARK
jgi:hypothetical protein